MSKIPIHTLIKQPNAWTCGASCACMITNTTLEEFYSFCGHDGSAKVASSEKNPIGVQCFTFKELASYLFKHNMMFGLGFDPPPEFNPSKHLLDIDISKLTAFLTVESVTPGLLHLVLYWDGIIIDPLNPYVNNKVEDYTILDWWPITKL